MQAVKKFDEAVAEISPDIARTLSFLPTEIKTKVEEIRLRSGFPVSLTIGGKSCYVTENSGISEKICKNLLISDEYALQESFLSLCRHSVYDHSDELKEGFIQSISGNRVGVCGRFSEGGILSEITSLNIRIAHEIIGCATSLIGYAKDGLLIAGPPGCGKTTVLRDLIRCISQSGKRVAVIDGRGELSGIGRCAVGQNTDVLKISDKAAGVQIALRTLFPDFIAFDEIGNSAELSAVAESFCAGVTIITTAHAGDAKDLLKRPVCRELLHTGTVKYVAVFKSPAGSAPQIIGSEELF